MSATASHPTSAADPSQLTFRYTTNPDGWVTAQIAERPEAISQGASEHEAYINVLEALHDLTHEPTLTERLFFTAQARLAEQIEWVQQAIGERLAELASAVRDRSRDHVH